MPTFTVSITGERDRTFTSPLAAAVWVLRYATAEQLQKLKAQHLRTLQNKIPVVLHEDEESPAVLPMPTTAKVLRIREPSPPNSGDLS